MKKSFLILFSVCLFTNAFAQKTEFRVALNSGLSSFYGDEATNQTSLLQITSAGSSNIEAQGLLSIHGKDVNPFIGVSFNVNRVTKKDFIYGIDLGIESQRNTVDINSIQKVKINDSNPGTTESAKGNTELLFKSINLNPYVGHRFYFNKYSIDATAGVDLAYLFKSEFNFNVIGDNGTTASSNTNLRDKKIDIRPRVQLAVNYNKYGFYVGYSFGIKNYVNSISSEYTDGAYSRQIRFGVSYKIK